MVFYIKTNNKTLANFKKHEFLAEFIPPQTRQRRTSLPEAGKQV